MKEYKFKPIYVALDEDEREVTRRYDERQLVFRRRGEVIALWFFASAVLTNTFIMELMYQWVSYLGALLIFGALAFFVFNIYAASKSASLSVNMSVKKEESHALVSLLCVVGNLCIWLNDFDWVMIADGKMTKGLTVIIAGALFLCSFGINILSVVKARIAEKAEKKEVDE